MLRRCCGFHVQESVSVVVIFKIEIARDFYVTKRRIDSTSWGVCRHLGCSRRAPSSSAALRLLTVAASRSIKLSLRTCRSNSVSFYFTQTFPEKVLVVSNHALFIVQEQSLPDFRLHVGSVDRRWIRKCEPQRASCHTTNPADRCARSFRSTPKCSHEQLARLASLSFVRVGNESRF